MASNCSGPGGALLRPPPALEHLIQNAASLPPPQTAPHEWVELIQLALEHPQIFVFKELLDLPELNVNSLKELAGRCGSSSLEDDTGHLGCSEVSGGDSGSSTLCGSSSGFSALRPGTKGSLAVPGWSATLEDLIMHVGLLKVFAFGTVPNFRRDAAAGRLVGRCRHGAPVWPLSASACGCIGPLTRRQAMKLRMLTIVSLSTEASTVGFGELVEALQYIFSGDVNTTSTALDNLSATGNANLATTLREPTMSLRTSPFQTTGGFPPSTSVFEAANQNYYRLSVVELQALLIETMSCELLRGKINECAGVLEVHGVMARDVEGSKNLHTMIQALFDFEEHAAAVLRIAQQTLPNKVRQCGFFTFYCF
eukprot:GHVT01045215.1.p1 GENE.GHVT01045215.1~~GHVT01045215.1.p1  ORF type:complete len:367 (-),score=41.66 GHVT01045215.1:96-1196(-)